MMHGTRRRILRLGTLALIATGLALLGGCEALSDPAAALRDFVADFSLQAAAAWLL